MSTVRFSKDEFEATLEQARQALIGTEICMVTQRGSVMQHQWIPKGLGKGEYWYTLPVCMEDGKLTNKRIVVRSSIGPDGYAKSTGQDSIRLWAEYYWKKRREWRAMAKLDRWTTRVPGWERRVSEKVTELWGLAVADCKAFKANGWQATVKDTKADTSIAGIDTSKMGEGKLPRRLSGTGIVATTKDIEAKEDKYAAEHPPAHLAANKITTISKPQPIVIELAPSPYQQRIVVEVETTDHNIVIVSVPGSGKTTTLEMSLGYLDQGLKIAFLAFNKDIVSEMSRRLKGKGYHISTFHSLALGNIKAVYPKVLLSESKVYELIKRKYWSVPSTRTRKHDVLYQHRREIKRLVVLCKDTLVQPTSENLNALARRFDLFVSDTARETVHEAVEQVFRESLEITNVMDFADIIYFCAMGMVPCKKFDVLMIDEAQDLNQAQIQMSLNCMANGGRIIAAGDPNQSIYGFRGADPQAMEQLIDATNAITLPLSVTYRCPTSHVQLLKELVPRIEAAPNAIEGTHGIRTYEQFFEMVQVDDVMLCRTNAPLIGVAWKLLAMGVHVCILGKKIGNQLIDMIKDVKKRYSKGFVTLDLNTLLKTLRCEQSSIASQLEDNNQGRQAAMVIDKVNAIESIALGTEARTIDDVIAAIAKLFSNTRAAVTLSTVHKFKGKQADRIWILEPQLMPHPQAKSEDDLLQEKNIEIVAKSRAKKELWFIIGELDE